MAMRYYFSRIFHDKVKRTLIIMMLLIPSLDILVILADVWRLGFAKPIPLHATFISMYSMGHKLQSIFFWFLPIYFLIIASEDSIEDAHTGNKNALISRMGSRKYYRSKVAGSFLMGFGIMFFALTLNLILVLFLFHGGTEDSFEGVILPGNVAHNFSRNHPFTSTMIHCIAISLLAGALCSFGTSLAATIRDRKIVYGVTFLGWLVPIYIHPSLMVVVNPFTEYELYYKLTLYLTVFVEYVIVILAVNIYENKYAKL